MQCAPLKMEMAYQQFKTCRNCRFENERRTTAMFVKLSQQTDDITEIKAIFLQKSQKKNV